MLEEAMLWLIPLVLLVGDCMLIVSTSARHSRVVAELRQVPAGDAAASETPPSWLLGRQLHLYRAALVSLYASAVLLPLASLAGGATVLGLIRPLWPAMALTVLGTAGLACAAVELLRQTVLAPDAPLPAAEPRT